MGVARSWDRGDAHKRPHSRGAIFVRTQVMRQAKPKPSPQSRPSSDQSGCGEPGSSRSGTAHERTNGKKEKEAERRQALSATACLAASAHPAQGALACRRSTTALPLGLTHPKVQPGPGFAEQAPVDGGGIPPAFAPVPASTSHAGHNAGRHDVRAARVQRGRTLCPQAPQPAPPAGVTGRRPFKQAGYTLLVRWAGRVQEIPFARIHLLDPTRYFFRCLFDARRGNCGIVAMIRTFAANPRASSGFFQFYSLYIVISSAGGEQIGRYELTWIERSESRPAPARYVRDMQDPSLRFPVSLLRFFIVVEIASFNFSNLNLYDANKPRTWRASI